MPNPARSLPVSQLLQRLSLRQLRAFLAVAQAGSMTQAAALMHLTPSALSMLVKSLEQELDIQLFERSTRKLLPTEAALSLLPVVQTLLLGLEQSIEQLRSQSQRTAQRITVATSPLMASSLLPELIASFRLKHPEAEIQLIDTAVDQVATWVRTGQAQIGVCTLDHQVDDLKASLLMEDALMLACPASHPWAAPQAAPSIAWRQLLGQRLVLLSKGSGLRHLVDQTLNRLPIKARQQAAANSGEHHQPLHCHEVAHVATAVGLVRAGEGVAVLPAYALQRAIGERSSIVVKALVQPVVKRKIVALSALQKPLSPLGQQYIAHIKRAVNTSL